MSAEQYKSDFQTPADVARYMVSMVPCWAKTVLEPTPGLGTIVNELKGFDVTAPKDFFTLPKSRFDCIVMNPPFSHKYAIMDNAPLHFYKAGMRLGYAILTECLNMSDNVIALMPWFTISDSDVRLRSLKKYGIKSVTALPRKTFQFARIQTVVLEMERGYKGDTIFKVYDLLKHPEHSMKDELFTTDIR